MPYKVVDNIVYHKKNGRWQVKQKCSSHENALAAVRLLQGLESGSIKKEDIGKTNKKKTKKKGEK